MYVVYHLTAHQLLCKCVHSPHFGRLSWLRPQETTESVYCNCVTHSESQTCRLEFSEGSRGRGCRTATWETLVLLISLHFLSPGAEASMNKRDGQRSEGPAAGEPILPSEYRRPHKPATVPPPSLLMENCTEPHIITHHCKSYRSRSVICNKKQNI